MKNFIKTGGIVLFIALMLMLCMGVAQAHTLDYYNIDYSLGPDNVLVEESLFFEKKVSGNFKLKLPKGTDDITVYVDNELIESEFSKTILTIPMKDSRKININYLTTGVINNNGFESKILMPVDAHRLKVSLTMPADVDLGSTSNEESLKPNNVKINETIVMNWVVDDPVKKDEILLKVDYGFGSWFDWIFVPLLLLVIVLLIFYLHKNKKKKSSKKSTSKSSKKTTGKKAKSKSDFSDNEQKVLDILAQRGNECNSQILKVITGMKKSDLDKALKRLEKKNKIKFKKSEKKGNGLVKLVK